MNKERKSIQINKTIHDDLKKLCLEYGIVLKTFVENSIKDNMVKYVNSISTSKKG
jgi:hypothetical protein